MHLSSALSHGAEIQKKISGKKAVVFLDYDGTLSPIVGRPELAVLSDKMRQVVVKLAQVCTVAIISGRARSDVENMVQINDLFFAGSHGFDIKGPGIAMTPAAVEPLLPKIAAAYSQLKNDTQGIKGCLIENKKYALAIHYRLVASEEISKIEQFVDAIVAGEPGLKKTGGKKIFEIRANISWGKGTALQYLLKALHLTGPNVVPFYLGDDETDEDAFVAIRGIGIGILVSDTPQESAASYSLKDVGEVRGFLEALTAWLS